MKNLTIRTFVSSDGSLMFDMATRQALDLIKRNS
jgi:hypothetical protein